MRSSRLLSVCATAALVPALVACGSSSSSGPSKAQYVAKADAICNAASNKTAALISRIASAAPALASGSPKAAREIAPTLKQVQEEGAASLAELRALKQPKGDKKAIEGFLSPLTNIVTAIGQAAGSFSAGQPSTALSQLANVQGDVERGIGAARAYGVGRCAGVGELIGADLSVLAGLPH
jgi:hypothetical protein